MAKPQCKSELSKTGSLFVLNLVQSSLHQRSFCIQYSVTKTEAWRNWDQLAALCVQGNKVNIADKGPIKKFQLYLQQTLDPQGGLLKQNEYLFLSKEESDLKKTSYKLFQDF